MYLVTLSRVQVCDHGWTTSFWIVGWLESGESRKENVPTGNCSHHDLWIVFFLIVFFLRKYKHFYSTYLWYRLKNIDGKNHCRWQKKYLFDFGVNNPFKVIFTHLCIKPMTILFYSLKKKPFGVFFDIFTLKYILIAVLLVIGMYISTLQPAPLTWVTDFSTSSTSE